MANPNKALPLHKKLKGKISIESKVKLDTREVLSLAYTPGVAEPVREIAADSSKVWELTMKGNTVAVVSDGSAVLGLGNVGAKAAIPVMEGKCAIFKEFAGIDAFPICIETQKVDELVTIIKNISPIFGGINIEDISAPRCFEIEDQLQNLGIPVMHDDQHATAIIILAALLNAVKVVKKDLLSCKIVVNGVGAAGTATIKILSYLKIRNIIAVDSQGIISRHRSALSPCKKDLLKTTNPQNLSGTLKDAVENADILIGLSKKGVFTQDIIELMHSDPIIFAMANPIPEVLPNEAKKWGAAIIATGRSDYPNQINNCLVFPGFFQGLLKYKISKITSDMKIETAYAIAKLVQKPTSENFVPTMFDKRVVPTIVQALRKFA